MFISPAERTFKHNLTGRIGLCVPALIFLTILGIISVDQKVAALWWAAAAGAIALTVWGCALLGKNRVEIHAEGMLQQGPFSAREIAWQDVTETRFKQNPLANSAAVHFGLIGAVIAAVASSRTTSSGGTVEMKVASADGTRISLSSNYRDVAAAIREVLRRVNPRLLQEARRRVRQGDTVQFGNLSLNVTGVIWKSKPPIPYGDITKAVITGTHLRVKQQGKWLDPIAVRTEKIPNVFVALDLIEEMQSGGARQVDPLVRAMRLGG